MQDLNLKSLFFENVINIEVDGVKMRSKHEACPLKMWNKVVRRVTQMTIADDLKPAYAKMCTIINEHELQGQLETRPELFTVLKTAPKQWLCPPGGFDDRLWKISKSICLFKFVFRQQNLIKIVVAQSFKWIQIQLCLKD